MKFANFFFFYKSFVFRRFRKENILSIAQEQFSFFINFVIALWNVSFRFDHASWNQRKLEYFLPSVNSNGYRHLFVSFIGLSSSFVDLLSADFLNFHNLDDFRTIESVHPCFLSQMTKIAIIFKFRKYRDFRKLYVPLHYIFPVNKHINTFFRFQLTSFNFISATLTSQKPPHRRHDSIYQTSKYVI